MLIVSEAITRSALLRKESRGAHSRLDFEGMRDEFSKINHCVTKSGDTMNVEPTPLPEMPAEMKELFEQAKVKA
jgi:succinate dehydrogenase / fumarate reductase flavoprotein subunit